MFSSELWNNSGVVVPDDVTLAFLSNEGSETDASSYTFTGKSFGDTATDRRIFVGVYGLDNSGSTITTSTVTVGGVSATKVVEVTNDTSINGVSAIWQADVPSGTSGTVVIAFSTTIIKMGYALWRVTGGVDEKDTASSTSSNFTLSLDVNDNGGAIGYAGNRDTPTWTWTGLTEDFEGTAGSAKHSGASDTFASGGSKTVGANCSGSGHVTVFASF
tara:strand:+ start:325 stop:975 length:651 start_codon:yes stop_codon:yes gene_type:complete